MGWLAVVVLAQQVRIEEQWSGTQSQILSQEFHRVTDAKGWKALWARHSTDPAPRVNFDRFMVIASFFGEATEWCSVNIELSGVTRNRSTVMVTYARHMGDAVFPEPRTTSRFSILVIPRSRDRVLILLHSEWFGIDPSDDVLAEFPALRGRP